MEHATTAFDEPSAGPTTPVPLRLLAHGRSGDKGDTANIGIIARRREYLPILRRELTAEFVADYFAHLVTGPVRRYEWPGLHAFNFVLERALGGGGVMSLRLDAQGKGLAQILLEAQVAVPVALAAGLVDR